MKERESSRWFAEESHWFSQRDLFCCCGRLVSESPRDFLLIRVFFGELLRRQDYIVGVLKEFQKENKVINPKI